MAKAQGDETGQRLVTREVRSPIITDSGTSHFVKGKSSDVVYLFNLVVIKRNPSDKPITCMCPAHGIVNCESAFKLPSSIYRL